MMELTVDEVESMLAALEEETGAPRSFTRVTGDAAELRVSAVTMARDFDGVLEMTVLNGTERDQQSVHYDSSGQFLRVS